MCVHEGAGGEQKPTLSSLHTYTIQATAAAAAQYGYRKCRLYLRYKKGHLGSYEDPSLFSLDLFFSLLLLGDWWGEGFFEEEEEERTELSSNVCVCV